jgi:hypothetical protein
MVNLEHDITPKVLKLYLELCQYPILGRRIRQSMREEIFSRGIISPKAFEEEVREKAVQSQVREGITDPMGQEPSDIWKERVEHTRELLTVFYFAHNLPHVLFQEIVEELIAQRVPDQRVILSFNPELAPWSLLFEQGELYENYPPEMRAPVEHHLQEIIAVIVKGMISDHLSFIRVAREYFTIADLKKIRANRIGRGKVGGKAAGMLLAYKILQREGQARGIDIDEFITIPDSYFLSADAYYDFKSSNDLFYLMNQKYKSPDQIKADYPRICEAYLSGSLPSYVEEELAVMLEQLGNAPLIVRSSSLLEDSFNTSFAGKYESLFLPNQGTLEENLAVLGRAIILVYASVINPDALIYRQQMGLIDYDERMGVLIQRVEGRQYGQYFFPTIAGVGFSHNPYRWSKRIRSEEGLLRLVTGLGTRAVDRVGKDYPRMVALSHPELRPERNTSMQRHYSQHLMDVIDLENNMLKTLPIGEVFKADYPGLGGIVSIDQGGYLQPLAGRPLSLEPHQMVVTFDRLLSQGPFADLMRAVLDILEEAYQRPVDVEFAGDIPTTHPEPKIHLALLQCRPLSHRRPAKLYDLPRNIPEEDILFTADQQVPQGYVDGIRYIVYVDPRTYAQIPDAQQRIEVAQVVGRLNQILDEDRFILMGPGRWGSSNPQLGVRVTYTDIYNTRMLIEVAHADRGSVPEVSYGTHFFQDLVESDIYPLPLYPDDPDIVFKDAFFHDAPNALSELLPDDGAYASYVKVIDLRATDGNRTLTVVMNSEEERAIGYLVAGEAAEPESSPEPEKTADHERRA